MASVPRFELLFVGDKTLRVDPSDPKKTDVNGGEEEYAFWEWLDFGEDVVVLKNRVTHHSLRIYDGGKTLDACGGTGRHSHFKVHKGEDNSVTFESVPFPGRYVGCFEGVVKADKVGCRFYVGQKKQDTDDSEEVKMADDSMIDDLVERIPAGDWPGTCEWVKIYADNDFVVVGTAVIGKYPGSLFHEKLVALTRDATHGKGAMVRMRFDRNFQVLQLVVDAMRGYPIEAKALDAFQRRMFVADCEFYKLPSIAARFKSVEPTTPTPKPTKVVPLRIYGATYGNLNVTSTVRKLVSGGKVLDLKASNGTFTDPMPGTKKVFVLVYSIGGGVAETRSYMENDHVLVKGTALGSAVLSSSKLPTILGAVYGRGDVTSVVRGLVVADKLDVKADNGTFKDTLYGVVKTLTVVWLDRSGTAQVLVCKEHQRLTAVL